MKNQAIASSLSHVAALKELLEDLQNESVELHEHQYHYLVFGSWVIEAGQRKKRFRFIWDGRDSYLTVSTATFSDSHTHTEWNEMREQSGPATSLDAFRRVRTILKDAV
ncbi:MAG: hypothetical protein WD944_11730 [Steroidobacteraceae bacterium]